MDEIIDSIIIFIDNEIQSLLDDDAQFILQEIIGQVQSRLALLDNDIDDEDL